jgi:hypothetical protein
MTSSTPRSRPAGNAWHRALDSADALAAATAELRADRTGTLARIRAALHGVPDRHGALTLLGSLETDYTGELAPDLVGIALSHRYALQARQALGRLPAAEARQVVPPAVWAQLEATGDDDAYRRMAELLDHLGLAGALGTLCETAAASPDPEVREVAEDFRR